MLSPVLLLLSPAVIALSAAVCDDAWGDAEDGELLEDLSVINVWESPRSCVDELVLLLLLPLLGDPADMIFSLSWPLDDICTCLSSWLLVVSLLVVLGSLVGLVGFVLDLMRSPVVDLSIA